MAKNGRCIWGNMAIYKEYEKQDYNQYLIKNFKRHYISENGTVTLSFKTLEEIK